MSSFQVPVLGPTDGFLLPFPDSLPQLFLRCFPFAFAFGLSPSNPLSFVRFSSGSGYSAFCSSFPSLPGSASHLLPQCPPWLSPPRFPLSLWPGLPCLPSRFLYSAFLFVSFRPSLIRFPQLFLRCFPYALAFGIFRFPSASFRPLQFCLRLLSLLLLPFRTSRLRLTVASPVRRFHSRFHGFPRSSRPGFPCLASGSRTRLAVCFLSSLPASLPQLFHRCFPSFPLSLLFRAFPPAFRSLSVASACF